MEGKFEQQRADFILGVVIEGLEGRFEVWKADLRFGGQIRGMEGADLKSGAISSLQG